MDESLKLFEGFSVSPSLSKAVERWYSLAIPEYLKIEVLNLIKQRDEEELIARFSHLLNFGTAGVRAKMGAGFGYFNEYTVAWITCGVASFLEKQTKTPHVVLSYDSRHCSLLFAHTIAKTLLNKGFHVIMFSIPSPSPILAYATRFYQADMGIMVTASHNPKTDNGYKIYSPMGGQFTSDETNQILSFMNDNPDIPWSQISNTSLEGIQATDVSLLLSYFQDVQAQIPNFFSLAEYISIVYSPLMGTGKYYAQELVSFIGGSILIVEEENCYNGCFLPDCPPNPEYPKVFQNAIALAQQKKAPICIVTDPDADRIGLWEQGKYFNGNEVGIILSMFLLEHQPQKRQKTLVNSIVSTQTIENIANYWGCDHRLTLTGFKYIGSVIQENPESFLFGFEESGGYLFGSYIQDKDGIACVALIHQIGNYLYSQNKTFSSYLEDIFYTVGFSKTQNIEITLSQKSMEDFFTSTKTAHHQIFQCAINEDVDFSSRKFFRQGEEMPFPAKWEDFPSTNLRIFYLEHHLRLAIRPSGTEPKLKLYLELFIPPQEIDQKKKLLAKYEKLQSFIENLSSFKKKTCF